MTSLAGALRELPDGVSVDLLESDDAYRYVVDVPGASADDVDVTAAAGRLSIEAATGARPADHDVLASSRDRTVDATLPLPPDAETDADATARVERGVLTVTLPKRDLGAETDVAVEGP